jgi:hypothetical protein
MMMVHACEYPSPVEGAAIDPGMEALSPTGRLRFWKGTYAPSHAASFQLVGNRIRHRLICGDTAYTYVSQSFARGGPRLAQTAWRGVSRCAPSSSEHPAPKR